MVWYNIVWPGIDYSTKTKITPRKLILTKFNDNVVVHRFVVNHNGTKQRDAWVQTAPLSKDVSHLNYRSL